MPRRRKSRNSVAGTLTILAMVAILLLALQSGWLRDLKLPEVTLPEVTLQLPAGTLLPPLLTQKPPESTEAPTSGWYSVYFSDPSTTGARTYRGGPDETVAAAIAKARLKVDIAAYQFNLFSLRDALIAAHRRGVQVRMVTDSDYTDEAAVQALIQAGIPVLGDRREGLMHNKFIVIDGQEVWTGSMNFTINGAYKNNNNLIRIRSQRMAQDYTAEFEEMFVDDHFGPGSPANTPYPSFKVDGTQIEVYFSPDDGVEKHLLALVGGAKQSIQFLAYSFTQDDLGKLIISRARAGVSVAGVMEAEQVRSNQGTEYDRFQSSGLDVRLDGNPNNMHDKVIILDGQTVITGSYNFSNNAENSNDENLVVIHNASIAAQYAREFQKIFAAAQH